MSEETVIEHPLDPTGTTVVEGPLTDNTIHTTGTVDSDGTVNTVGTVGTQARVMSPLDPDALSPVNATGVSTPQNVARAMTPAKSQLLGEFENLLHGVPDDLAHDKEAMMVWVNGEIARLRILNKA